MEKPDRDPDFIVRINQGGDKYEVLSFWIDEEIQHNNNVTQVFHITEKKGKLVYRLFDDPDDEYTIFMNCSEYWEVQKLYEDFVVERILLDS